MPALSTDEFLDLLKRSDLLESEEYEAVIADIKKKAPNVFSDASLLAAEFIKRNHLTVWHVRQLMKRKYKGFYLRQYRILGHLGSGGMSSVYLGEHTVMKRRVAIKVLPKRRLNPVYLDRFAREAQAIASLDSQHVVRAYDVDRFEDVHYIVMEYFEGQNLRQLVEKEGPLAYEDAASYIRQAALGLADAHKCGVVHRDVKPENIVVDDHDFVKILDLGLALLDEGTFDIQGSMFDEDKILGTADYLAPEQALDSHNVDARADIYGLGATFYFCLTGKPPFPTGTISERLLAHQRKEPASIFNERPDAPADLVELCSKMMAKKPDDRIQSASQVAEIMKRWLIRHGFAQSSDFFNEGAPGDEGEDNLDSLSVDDSLSNDEKATDIGFDRDDSRFRLSETALHGVAQNVREDSVDLYDAYPSESGGSISRLNKSSASSIKKGNPNEGLVLSQSTGMGSQLDPFELAMSEIADTTKHRLGTEENSLSDSTESRSTPSEKSSVALSTRVGEKAQQSPSRPSVTSSSSSHSSMERSSKSFEQVRRSFKEQETRRQATSSSTSQTRIKKVEAAPSASSQVASETKLEETREHDVRSFIEWYREVPIWFWTIAVGGYALAIFLAGILIALILTIPSGK